VHSVLGKINYGGLKHISLYLGLVLPSGTEPHWFELVLDWSFEKASTKFQPMGCQSTRQEQTLPSFLFAFRLYTS